MNQPIILFHDENKLFSFKKPCDRYRWDAKSMFGSSFYGLIYVHMGKMRVSDAFLVLFTLVAAMAVNGNEKVIDSNKINTSEKVNSIKEVNSTKEVNNSKEVDSSKEVNASIVEDRFYPRYHLAAPRGWMGKLNGFCMENGEHHLFYLFNPNSSHEPGSLHWGHAKSINLFHWEHQRIALYPDKIYDKSGVLSGTILVENETMYAFYTGKVNHPGEDPDYEEHVCFANQYGPNFVKHPGNPIIQGNEHQPNFRDPQVWKYNDSYYAAIGTSYLNGTKGRIVLYKSSQFLREWSQVSIMYQTNDSLGNMWESPNLFELDSYYVLLFSPNGMKPMGSKYMNYFVTLYMIGDFDYKSHTFVPISILRELDHGHDFYAPQTLVDDIGRRILIAWFGTGARLYPEVEDGFAGCMTLPRELSFGRHHELLQKPLAQTEHARGHVVRRGKGYYGDSVVLPDKTGEVIIKAKLGQDVQVFIDSDTSQVLIRYDAKKKLIILDRGGEDGVRQARWKPRRRLHWIIYIDASSVELFSGEGEVTFTSRFFPTGTVYVRLGEQTQVHVFKVTEMQRTIKNITLARSNNLLYNKEW